MRKWAVIFTAGLVALGGCGRERGSRVQGYVEGEFAEIASPLGGQLEALDVSRGEHVEVGTPLFTLEREAEEATVAEATKRLEQAESSLKDVQLGQRPSELQALQAQLDQANAALVLSEKEFARQEKLMKSGVSAPQELDQARAQRDQDRERVSRLKADLITAHLGSRSDQIDAAAANVKALQSALARAQWSLDQKQQAAPVSGLVFDTLYRKGEWVPAGQPVIALLPPENITVRAFVPEKLVGKIHPGDTVEVFIDGRDAPVTGRVAYVAPRAEFTPPVIYSNEAREKLVFMVEIAFSPEIAATLNPGQPVDVEFGP